jgi:prepilin-type N-terminal cleavage/methylation domain-containing protein
MNLSLHSASSRTRRQRGMTLIEMMFTVALMTMVIAAVMSANFLGWREESMLETKAGACDSSRQAIGQLLYDIRAAKGFDIGTYAGTNFTAITNGTLQGNSVKLYTIAISTNQVVDPSRYTLYYFDASQSSNNNGILWRRSNTNAPDVVASNLISTLYFTSEDYLGRTQAVRTYKGVIHTTLQFSQFLYPLTRVGSNQLYDYYRVDCRATPHIPDGQ